MPEHFDVYMDGFQFTVSPYGVALSIGRSSAHPTPGKPETPVELGVLRMSLENAKVLTMLLQRDLKLYERQNDLEIPLPVPLYAQLGIAREDWADGGAS